MKQCYVCKETKECEDFGKNKSKIDGLASECKRCKKAADKLYYTKNKSKLIKKSSDYYYNNTESILERNRSYFKEYRKKNKPFLSAKQAKRRASKLTATPTWANKEVIEAIYFLAKWYSFTCFQEYHVDHIVPLKGNKVCGLHCEDNLQILTATENLRKSNKYV